MVIDPLPKSVKESSEDETETPESQRQIPSPRKSSLGPRLPVIPPSSVKITSDGNLAGKLEALTGQAEAKLKQMALEEQRPLLDRADEEERGDISSNNDVTGQEPKEVVESI